MTDIDAMAKDMPRIRRIADQMERVLADPFVASNTAEREDALADLAALREFRDKIPEFEERMGALDGMVKDVAELKNRPQFDPSMIPQPEDAQPGLNEDRVREIIQEMLSSTAPVPSTSVPVDGAVSGLTEERVRELITQAQGDDGDPQMDVVTDKVNEMSDKIEAFMASHQDTGGGDDSGLGDRVSVMETKLDALMDALDVQQSDLGASDAPGSDQPAPVPVNTVG